MRPTTSGQIAKERKHLKIRSELVIDLHRYITVPENGVRAVASPPFSGGQAIVWMTLVPNALISDEPPSLFLIAAAPENDIGAILDFPFPNGHAIVLVCVVNDVIARL